MTDTRYYKGVKDGLINGLIKEKGEDWDAFFSGQMND